MKVFTSVVCIPVKVEKDLILEANCSDEGRLEDIFNSLKEQFKD